MARTCKWDLVIMQTIATSIAINQAFSYAPHASLRLSMCFRTEDPNIFDHTRPSTATSSGCNLVTGLVGGSQDSWILVQGFYSLISLSCPIYFQGRYSKKGVGIIWHSGNQTWLETHGFSQQPRWLGRGWKPASHVWWHRRVSHGATNGQIIMFFLVQWQLMEEY